ncbi:hypothetical protein [Sphingopyxis sp. EG6]|jgi:hypothetical protein|uniref:hypothetical protein n=1 Tax=Sphingopyxis sp. EG6 TaxID=1874061 RepID=UPI000DC61936|nr:hypothetical protein [Sphingopyxis sp. EG6]BBB08705.1 hypothetical protein SPYCW_1721 [Sphingopyxis sp. EG6]
MSISDFEAALEAIPEGYSEGLYLGRRYGVTRQSSDDGKRNSLFARELAGTDFISFNLYRLQAGRTLLKPCEMPEAKVRAFVADFTPAT